MNRLEFIEQYIMDHGHEPDEETIAYYTGRDIFQSRPHNFQPQQYSRNGADDLLLEIRDVVSGISENARVAYNNRHRFFEQRPYLSEFGFMLAIFGAKSMLYFLMKNSYEAGMDLSNI